MAGTIYSGTYVTTIFLNNPATQRPVTVTGKIINAGGQGIFGNDAYAWIVNNRGTIESTSPNLGSAIQLSAGGTINNKTAGSLIEGSSNGVLILLAPGTVNNFGTIEGTGVGSNGIDFFAAGGQVVNGSAAATAALISSVDTAVLFHSGGAGTVTNFGTIATADTSAAVNVTGDGGGAVTNGSSTSTAALITGNGVAVYISDGPGTVTNFAKIKGSTGVSLIDGGRVGNGRSGSTAGLIIGTSGHAIKIDGAVGSVANFGTVQETGSNSAIDLAEGGTVANGKAGATTASIISTSQSVSVEHAPGTVTNFGTMNSTLASGGSTIRLGAGGSVTNFGTVMDAGSVNNGVYISGAGVVTNGAGGSTSALITAVHTGVAFRIATGSVANFGTITGSGRHGIYLELGGNVTNGAKGLVSGGLDGIDFHGGKGKAVNLGTIKATGAGGQGIALLGGGTVSNGASGGAAASIIGTGPGIYIGNSPGSVTNFGTIRSQSANGVHIIDGGSVTNQAGGEIVGHINGIYGRNTAVSIKNLGSIETTGTGDGVQLIGGGSVTNGKSGSSVGVIRGATAGVYVNLLPGTVTNYGTIEGVIGFEGLGDQRNTLINFGTVASTSGAPGAVAVELGNNVLGKLLVVGKGAVFKGLVEGGGRGEIEFASPGTAAMGGNISGFNTVRLANGGADTLTLNNANVSGIKGALTVICGDKGNTVNASAVTTLSKLIIDGGAGKDVLTGTGNPGGRTIFVFSAKALTAADKITASGFNNELDLTTPGTVAAGGVSAVQIYRLANGGKNTLVLKSANFAGLPSNTVQIYGGNAGNTIDGSGVTGASQNLQIYGGGGADVLKGGAGNDVFVLSAATLTGSVVEGGGGNNELEITTAGILPVAAVTGIETYVLADSGANALSLTSANFAGVAGHVITVSDGNGDSTVSGSTLPAADRLNLYAGTGADELTGGAGGDALFAGGDTTMTGKAGANQFTFSAPGNNTITDFGASSANQMVFVSGSGFSLPGATIAPKPLGGLFTAGAFTSPSQRFSYTGGKLFYSATGSVSSEHLVATLSGSPVLNPAHLLFMS